MAAPVRARRPGPDTLAFAALTAAASIMAAGYALDLAGVAMHPVALAIVALASGAAVVLLPQSGTFDRTSAVRTRETAIFLAILLVTAAYLLWLASPSLLPVTIGPDVVHHLQLIHVIQRTHRLAHDPALRPFLVEMVNYTPGSHILAATVADWIRSDAVRVVQPMAAIFVAWKMGLLYLVARRAVEREDVVPFAAAAAPVLAFAPAVYTLGSSFHFFFFAQVISETFALGMLLAALGWEQTRQRAFLAAFAACGVGVFLAWPVWLGPGAAVMAFAIVRAAPAWRARSAAAVAAFAPIALVAGVHSVLHAEGGRILGSAGAVTAPSVAAFGPAFLACTLVGLVVAVRARRAWPIVIFLAVTLAQALTIAALDARAGARTFYLPFKMMYLAVFPCAALAAVALQWIAASAARRVPALRRAVAVVPLAMAIMIVAGRVPFARQSSPITIPALEAGEWTRSHVAASCVDYFTKHWLTGYWLHLDVLGNPRVSDRMRAETFDFPDTVGKWLEGRGLPYGIVEDATAIPRELRPELVPVHTAGSVTVVRNLHAVACP